MKYKNINIIFQVQSQNLNIFSKNYYQTLPLALTDAFVYYSKVDPIFQNKNNPPFDSDQVLSKSYPTFFSQKVYIKNIYKLVDHSVGHLPTNYSFLSHFLMGK